MQQRDPSSMGVGPQHFAQLLQRIDDLERRLSAYQRTQPAYVQLIEVTEPAAGPTNAARLFAVDNGAGKTSLRVRFPTGATATIATEP